MHKIKFNIISCIILTIITISFGSYIWEARHDFIMGFNDGYKQASSQNESNSSQSFFIKLYPNSEEVTLPALFNLKNQTTNSYIPREVMVSLSSDRVNSYISISTFIIVLALAISFLTTYVFFIKFILRVNRQKYFDKKNVHYLKIVGLALIISGILELLCNYLQYNMISQAFQFEGYSITFDSGNSYLNIILGLSGLLISQFVGMAVVMKEEQELTI